MCRIHKFEDDQFRSGYYIEGYGVNEIIRQLLDEIYFDQYDYWNDEDAALPLPYEYASIFLHGSCNIFAYELHKKFGYDVYEIKSRDGKDNHCFCQSIFQNKPVYIDVRGMTTNFDEFLSEFKCKMWEDAGKAFAQIIIVCILNFMKLKNFNVGVKGKL